MTIQNEVTKAPVEQIRLDQIEVGPRLRERTGSVVSLKKSIADLGMMHPILVTDSEDVPRLMGKRYLLIAGERRLKAVGLLKAKSISARNVAGLDTINTLLQMEEAENEERLEMDAHALSEPRWREIENAYQGRIAEEVEKRGVTKTAAAGRVSRHKVATDHGVSRRTAQHDDQIVKAVKRIPELDGYARRPMLKIAEAIDALEPKERTGARRFIAAQGMGKAAQAAVANGLDNLAHNWFVEDRADIWKTKDTDEALKQSLRTAQGRDPRFDAVLAILGQIKDMMASFRRNDDAHHEIALARDHLLEATKCLKRAYDRSRSERRDALGLSEERG
jgi:ParB-like chromosome segregation protein Spo0J